MTRSPSSIRPAAAAAGAVDVHQHLWPAELIDRLRARSRAPYLRGDTLVTDGDPPYRVDLSAHDLAGRLAADEQDGVGLACVALSAPLGIESLPRPEADGLLRAWHRGALELSERLLVWASVAADEPDLGALADLLAEPRVAGLQVPATWVGTPWGWERMAPLLTVAARAGKPVLVHPGPETRRVLDGHLPQWWAPVVGYAGQLHAAWWAWHSGAVRGLLPDLRVVFAAGAGLAPLHHERHVLRGGTPRPVDPLVFVDTSGTGVQALDALVRVLGIDALVLGSDRPYGRPVGELWGEAATHAVRVANPRRLLTGEGVSSWAHAG